MRRAIAAAALLVCGLLGAWSIRAHVGAPSLAEPVPSPGARPVLVQVATGSATPQPGPAGHVPRVLMPDAERAGQIAGQIGEARWRAARTCADADLEAAARRFADARVDADHADWDALAATLDAVIEALDGCDAPDLAPVADRLRAWRHAPPFPE